MFTLSQLRSQPDFSGSLEQGKQLLIDAGLTSVNDWKPGSPELSFLQLHALLGSRVSELADAMSRVYVNAQAEGDALDQLSTSWYGNVRRNGQQCRRTLVLSSSAGQQPHQISAGDVEVQTSAGLKFVNDNPDPVVIPTGPAATIVPFLAVDNGTQYNVTSTNWSLITSLAGVTVQDADATSETGISVLGVDREADTALRSRNRSKWATLGGGDNSIDRVKHLALSASADIVDVSINDQNYGGAGTVDIYLSSATSPAPSGSVAAARSLIQRNFFDGSGKRSDGVTDRIQVVASRRVDFSADINVYHESGADTVALESAIKTAADAWLTRTPTGGVYVTGSLRIVNVNDFVADVEDIDGVRVCTVMTGSNLINQIAVQPLDKISKPVSDYAINFYPVFQDP